MVTATDPVLRPGILAPPRPAGWEALRAQAEAALVAQPWPTTRQESWKYTDVAALEATAFPPGSHAEVDIAALIQPEARGSRLVFVNGRYDSHRSSTANLPAGVRLLNLAHATELAHELGTLARPDHSDLFANLNSARFTDGALLIVPRGVQVGPPIHVLFISEPGPGPASSSLPRLFVVLERDSSATLVEEYQGRGRTFTSAVGEVIVRAGASLEHERIQRESQEAFHFSHLVAKVERDAHYGCRTISLGGLLSRTTPEVRLAEEGADLVLDGLALLSGGQLSDTHAVIDHLVPHCTSRQAHKVIADDSSQAVFNGMIYVHKDAQGTDAQQQCRGLLLSGHARIYAKPQLEIFADDVKCAHGAAIGQLDPEALFYLQSRGLTQPLARNLLTYAFAADLLSGINVPSLRRQLRQTVLARTHGETLEAL